MNTKGVKMPLNVDNVAIIFKVCHYNDYIWYHKIVAWQVLLLIISYRKQFDCRIMYKSAFKQSIVRVHVALSSRLRGILPRAQRELLVS